MTLSAIFYLKTSFFWCLKVIIKKFLQDTEIIWNVLTNVLNFFEIIRKMQKCSKFFKIIRNLIVGCKFFGFWKICAISFLLFSHENTKKANFHCNKFCKSIAMLGYSNVVDFGCFSLCSYSNFRMSLINKHDKMCYLKIKLGTESFVNFIKSYSNNRAREVYNSFFKLRESVTKTRDAKFSLIF